MWDQLALPMLQFQANNTMAVWTHHVPFCCRIYRCWRNWDSGSYKYLDILRGASSTQLRAHISRQFRKLHKINCCSQQGYKVVQTPSNSVAMENVGQIVFAELHFSQHLALVWCRNITGTLSTCSISPYNQQMRSKLLSFFPCPNIFLSVTTWHTQIF